VGYDSALKGGPIKFPKAAKPAKETVLFFKSEMKKADKRRGKGGKGGGGGKGKKLSKIPENISYAQLTKANPLRAPTLVETALGAGGARRIGVALQRSLRGASKAPPTLTAALLAGALAYGVTRAGLSKWAMGKATRRENAARLADAYKFARQKIAEDQGQELTPSQREQLARAFQKGLMKMGLSSRDMSPIMKRSAYDTSAPPFAMDK